jgi:hypothetical protein
VANTFRVRRIDEVLLKGRKQAIKVFELYPHS